MERIEAATPGRHTAYLALHERVDEWLEVGFCKFLLRPAQPPRDWTAELESLADDILERQT